MPDLLHATTDRGQQLGVAIEGERDALEDGVHVLEPGLDQRLGLHALDLELDLAELGVGATVSMRILRTSAMTATWARRSSTSMSISSTLTTGTSTSTSGPSGIPFGSTTA